MAIYPDKKGNKLTGRFRVEVQHQGRRLRGRFATLKEAQDAEKEFARRLQDGEVPEAKAKTDRRPRANPRTLLEALDAFADRVWPGKEHREQSISKVRHAASVIGDKTLAKITTKDIDNLIDALEPGREEATVNRHLSALHKLLKHCYIRKLLPEMPVFHWLEDEDEGRIRWITEEEEVKLLGLLQSYGADLVADCVAVAIDTGMRRGEMLSLEPAQVDRGWVRLWKTKTKRPRSVPLTPRAQEILDRRRATGLFKPLAKHTLRWYWDRAKRDMGLEQDEDFVFHACRHTCATRLVERGEDILVIAKYLGHRSLSTTRRYAHVRDKDLERAAAKLSGGTLIGVSLSETRVGAQKVGDLGVRMGFVPLQAATAANENTEAVQGLTGRGRGGTGRRAGFRFQ